MYDNLSEKIDYEELKWNNMLYVNSASENITDAFKIAYKKALYKKINDYIKNGLFTKEQEKELLLTKELVDYMYLKAVDNNLDILAHREISEETFKLLLKKISF